MMQRGKDSKPADLRQTREALLFAPAQRVLANGTSRLQLHKA